MLDWPTSSPKMTRMLGFAPFCCAMAGDLASAEILVARSAVASRVRNSLPPPPEGRPVSAFLSCLVLSVIRDSVVETRERQDQRRRPPPCPPPPWKPPPP